MRPSVIICWENLNLLQSSIGIDSGLLQIRPPKYANGHIPATGDPIHFMIGSRVGFSGTANRMALFSVRSNQRGRPAAVLGYQPHFHEIEKLCRNMGESVQGVITLAQSKIFFVYPHNNIRPILIVFPVQCTTWQKSKSHCFVGRTTFSILYSVSQKNPPCGFLILFPKRMGIFNQFLYTYYTFLSTLDC